MRNQDMSRQYQHIITLVLHLVSKFEPRTLELSNTLLCQGTWLSFMMQLVGAALHQNPTSKLEVGRVMSWHEAVAELLLEFAHLFKVFFPKSSTCLHLETNSPERSNTLRCHGTLLSFLIQPVHAALGRNPVPELGVDRVLGWHKAVAELHLEFAQFSEVLAPLRVVKSFRIISNFKNRSCIDTWLVLALASSFMNPLFGLIDVTLAHGEC